MQYNVRLSLAVRMGFGITLSLMVGVGGVTWTTMQRLHTMSRMESHTHEVIAGLKGLEKSLVDTETGQRGFIFTNREDFLEPYFEGKDAINGLFLELQNLVADNPGQVARLNALKRPIDLKLQELAQTIQLKRNGDTEQLQAVVLSGVGKRWMDEIRAMIAAAIQVENDLLVERQAATERLTRLTTLVIIGGTGGAVAIGGIVLVFIGRHVIQPIDRVASQIDCSSSEIAAAVEEQEKVARNQAAVATQTNTTMDELGASARQSAERAEAAAAGAQEVLFLSEGGVRAVERTLQGMAVLQDKVSAIAEKILRLSEQTMQIGTISKLVSDLANQTNMLALNAAVEAVRAGDRGQGFAVVSTEIRKLADESKKSAERINILVRDVQSAIDLTVLATDEGTKTVEEGMRIAEETSQAFSGVTGAVNNIAIDSQQISLTTQQQAAAIKQILVAMADLNQAARENALGIAQVREGTRDLNDSAIRLKAIV